ncbi:unnamed protein product, partial [marine sediment metagenome]
IPVSKPDFFFDHKYHPWWISSTLAQLLTANFLTAVEQAEKAGTSAIQRPAPSPRRS